MEPLLEHLPDKKISDYSANSVDASDLCCEVCDTKVFEFP